MASLFKTVKLPLIPNAAQCEEAAVALRRMVAFCFNR